jgi:hypothetical protein
VPAVTVYQRSGLIADLDALEAKINAADDEEGDGPSMGGGVGKLHAEYAKLAQQFHDSALTIRVQGHDEADKRRIAEANPGLDSGELGYIIVAERRSRPRRSRPRS